MGSVVSRLSQLALGDLDSALDPDAYRPKLETEFNTPESKTHVRIQLPDPRSLSRGIERTPLFAIVNKEEVIVNSTPIRPGIEKVQSEDNEDELVRTLPKRLLETNLDDSEIEPIQLAEEDETDVLQADASEAVEDSSVQEVSSVELSEVAVQEQTEAEKYFEEPLFTDTVEEPPSVEATTGTDLLNLRKNLFTTPQQSIKSKRVPLGFVCTNTNFDTLLESPLLNDKNWKNASDERYRRGLTASDDPENTPPSVLRLTDPPEGVQSAPGKFRNPCRKRIEPRNSSGLLI